MTDHDSTDSGTSDDYHNLFDERVRNVNQSIEDFHVEVDLSGPEVADRFHAIGAELRKDGEIVADFTAKLSEAAGEAWHDLKEAGERAVERLEGDVATARADLTAELADDPSEYRTAAREQAETWKAHLERLKLHAKLGEMEARDKVAELEEAYQRAKPELDKAGEAASETLDALKTQVRGLVDHLRRAARDFSDEL